MTKLRLGTIGTSQITHQFIDAAIESGHYSLQAVYSRTMEKAELVKSQYNAQTAYDNWTAFLEDKAIDVIYIASPNSLHFKQAMEAAQHKKHLIIEKPIVTSLAEWDELINLGKQEGIVIVEAARHIFEPNFKKVTEMIKSFQTIVGATLSYSKYSSRYDKVLAGEEPPIFSPTYAGGAVNDLGIYVVYAAVQWFGVPETVHGFSQTIRTGVDGKGTAILRYSHFDVVLNYGKMNTTLNASEIYNQEQTLVLDAVTGVEKVELVDARTKTSQHILLDEQADNPLMWEAEAFAEVMKNPGSDKNRDKLKEWTELSYHVHRILEQIRKN